MTATPFDTRSSEVQGELALWSQLHAEGNEARLSRLRSRLRQARQQELTPRQQEYLFLYYDCGLSMTEIARRSGVHPSTVSRTLQRAISRLHRVLQYAF